MFKSITRTWNIFTGCFHGCTYCSARTLATGRLKHFPRYKDGFIPHFNNELLDIKFKPGEFVFVAYMGDIAFCLPPFFGEILKRITEFPATDFLIMSKNPAFFEKWDWAQFGNVVLGTTLETNRDYQVSKAPPPGIRGNFLALIKHPRKMVSIEPVMDFDLDPFLSMVGRIRPEVIEVGADNYHHHLPEPPPDKLKHLLRHLNDICPRVIEKDGLERLLERG